MDLHHDTESFHNFNLSFKDMFLESLAFVGIWSVFFYDFRSATPYVMQVSSALNKPQLDIIFMLVQIAVGLVGIVYTAMKSIKITSELHDSLIKKVKAYKLKKKRTNGKLQRKLNGRR